MFTPAQARAAIADLVAHFRANAASLAHAPEAQIEETYLRPLFRYLNWNVSNTGLAVADWEFVLQRTDDKGRRPDYILQLEGQAVLVMDAKKVKYDLHDPRWMQQVYAYAYSTQNLPSPRKIDFALLTDFQEFILLDCTLHAPNSKVVGNFRILDWTCEDYVTQFNTLWELFERENVRAALQARHTENPTGLWARYLSPKKVKANRTPPDTAFLAEMDDEKNGWRVRLAKDMKKHNPEADGDLLTAAVQLLINRLIFVKALSDREIEEDYLAQLAERVEQAGLAEEDTGWFIACRDIFEKLNHFYNGSVFQSRPELEAVTVSNQVIRAILHDLAPENSPYNFAALPVEILGTIYERFLGRVVRTTEQRVKVEDKPEVRKAGGVFYTPQYIVDYIVENTLGKLLATCQTPAEVAQLKILDPACGSGSFLLGAYTALIRWHEAYYSQPGQRSKRHREAAYYDAEGRVRLTARLKGQILLNNLFGVDIDEQAVEVTRFSLSLKTLEDTRYHELREHSTLFKQTILPDLGQNILCGNSVIAPQYFEGQMFPNRAEQRRVKPLAWPTSFPHIMPAGFDAIIGNPPYVRIQTLREVNAKQVDYLAQNFVAATGNYDLYVVFVEQALRLLGAQGHLGFILPHKFFNAKYGENLRQLISHGQHLTQIVHFGDQQVFTGATTYTALVFLTKEGSSAFTLTKVNNLKAWQANQKVGGRADSAQSFISDILPASRATAAAWNFSIGPSSQLFERLRQMPATLGDLAEKIAQGLRTSANEVYVLQCVAEGKRLVTAQSAQLQHTLKLERKAVLPFLQGRDIKAYHLANSGKFVLMPYQLQKNRMALLSEAALKTQWPLAYAYLLENKKHLEKREHGKMRGPHWYAYVYPKNLDVMLAPKLLVPDIADRAAFAIDELGEYAFTSGYGIVLKADVPESLKYLLGLLNSKVITFYLTHITTPLQNGFFRYFTQFLAPLPIRRINFALPADKAQHDQLAQLAQIMLTLKKDEAQTQMPYEREQLQRQIDYTARQIDELVYKLYELTPAEIAVVEGLAQT